ncbi:MAG: cation:proton antiporter, partial [Tepidimonas sp.]
MNSLDIALLYLLAAVLGVVVCRTLRLPAMIGYLAVGVLIGPHALALAQNSAGLRYLAEFGVVFLMFAIGLEFSLPKLRAMKRYVFGLGTAQVVATVLLTTLASLALGWWLPQWWKLEWQMALAMGGVMAMSSTAIVVKLMADRLELESEHGQRVVGILLFQDLAALPALLLVGAMASGAEHDLAPLLLRLGAAVVIFAGAALFA